MAREPLTVRLDDHLGGDVNGDHEHGRNDTDEVDVRSACKAMRSIKRFGRCRLVPLGHFPYGH